MLSSGDENRNRTRPAGRQENRTLAIQTPLGPDALVLASFTGREEISRLFSYQLELLSPLEFIPPQDIVGKMVNFSVSAGEGPPRCLNGYVSRFSTGDRDAGDRKYRAEVVPWLWFLTRTSNCRIFQNKTVPEVVSQVFTEAGFLDFDMSGVEGARQPWDYCVQYRETSFNFVSRLLEQEGIFYYFRHEPGRHVLVLADSPAGYVECLESSVCPFCGTASRTKGLACPECGKPFPHKKVIDYQYTRSSRAVVDRITRWERHFEYTPGKWAQTDYNFIDHPARGEVTPSSLLLSKSDSIVSLDGVSKYEMYDHPGEFQDREDGQAYTRIRMQEDEAGFDTAIGESLCKSFCVGGKFTIGRHECAAEVGKTYVITAIQHHAIEPAEHTGGEGVAFDYRNSFSCIPADVSYRPRRITPKPVIQGSQTAVVVGPKGEEIYPDKYGRVKVQFFWDREGKRDDKSSCWIRCMQTAAGKGWGSMFIPRIGQEVVVSYLEGDPDRPLITGMVYNADQMPPYSLPDEKSKTYLKTNSTQGGTGFNELRFEDKKDSEQVFLHAQRNMDVRVLNDSMEQVVNDRHLIVGKSKDGNKAGDHREMVYRDKHVKVHRDHVEQVGGNMTLLVGGIDGDGNQDIVIKNDKKETIEADSHVHVKADRKEKVDGSQSLTVGTSQQEKVGTKHALQAGQEIHLKSGVKVVIEAGLQLTLKGPGGFVDIGPTGVTIQGTLVNINSGGAAGSGSGSAPSAPQDAREAKPAEPTAADNDKSGQKSTPF